MSSTQDSSFLSLPGEIRNRIYEYTTLPRTVELKQGIASPCKSNTSLSNQWDGDRPFRSLTQLCREVRAEYLPIYLSYITVRLDSDDIHEYVETFALRAGVEAEDLIANLVFGFEALYVYDEFDILPLVRYAQVADNFNISFDLDWDTDKHISNILRKILEATSSSTHANSTLTIYIKKAVSKIHVRRDTYGGCIIVFLIKSAFWRLWMRAWTADAVNVSESIEQYTNDAMAWAAVYGFSEDEMRNYIDFRVDYA